MPQRPQEGQRRPPPVHAGGLRPLARGPGGGGPSGHLPGVGPQERHHPQGQGEAHLPLRALPGPQQGDQGLQREVQVHLQVQVHGE